MVSIEWLHLAAECRNLPAMVRGLKGQAWAYSTSHSQLLVRFYRPGSRAGIYLYCKMCDFVQFQSSWSDVNINIDVGQGQYGPIYTISDGERLRIVCGAVFFAETEDLVRLPDGV